ncbi:unnamed protein product [Gongylonema pulchrum]|uniref:Cyclic pyranopterin monophosphate synthase n=1 Tax=Gongylonema pulchrum TaxID=637853 RepID=A0A183F0M0_9BILA|nr:unnamed protein product [Gongylonema pulchrum]
MKVPVEDVGMAIATMVKMGKEKADRESNQHFLDI